LPFLAVTPDQAFRALQELEFEAVYDETLSKGKAVRYYIGLSREKSTE
jgi:hypothetical protein